MAVLADGDQPLLASLSGYLDESFFKEHIGDPEINKFTDPQTATIQVFQLWPYSVSLQDGSGQWQQ